MSPNLLVVNLHSSKNAGDHALTLETVRQLHAYFPDAHVTLALADPASADAEDDAIGSFYTWIRGYDKNGIAQWHLFPGVLLLLTALLVGGIWRVTKRLPRLWLTPQQHALIAAYTRADAVLSCAGTVFYTSGKAGLQFLLSLFIIMYGAWLGKPLYTLPQSVGPIRGAWERRLFTFCANRMRLLLVREPVSAQLLQNLGVASQRYRLVPDVAFSYQGQNEAQARKVLAPYLGERLGNVPLLGISVISWGDQNHRFQRQADYEAAVVEAVRRFLAETDGCVLFFPQMWGPAVQDDDRIPARRITQAFKETGRVHVVEEPMTPDVLKGCYALTDLFVGTRMHATIFALSVGTPVVAIGYRTKTAGLVSMLEWEPWMIEIDDVTTENLPALVMNAWDARTELRVHVARVMETTIREASEAVRWLAADFYRG